MITAENVKGSSGLGAAPRQRDGGVSQEWVKMRMRYKDGILYWKRCTSNNAKWNEDHEGKAVGTAVKGRGKSVMIEGKQYACHRLVWIYHHGDISPSTHVRHLKYTYGYRDRVENLYIGKRGL